MFDVLVFLYENYSALSACPDFEVLTRRLADAGFDEDEIADAMVWLHELASVTLSSRTRCEAAAQAFRVYSSQEYASLGPAAIGFIASLDRDHQLSPAQREIVIERAASLGETPVSLERLKIIVLMVLWSQSADVDVLLLQDLLDSDPGQALH